MIFYIYWATYLVSLSIFQKAQGLQNTGLLQATQTSKHYG